MGASDEIGVGFGEIEGNSDVVRAHVVFARIPRKPLKTSHILVTAT